MTEALLRQASVLCALLLVAYTACGTAPDSTRRHPFQTGVSWYTQFSAGAGRHAGFLPDPSVQLSTRLRLHISKGVAFHIGGQAQWLNSTSRYRLLTYPTNYGWYSADCEDCRYVVQSRIFAPHIGITWRAPFGQDRLWLEVVYAEPGSARTNVEIRDRKNTAKFIYPQYRMLDRLNAPYRQLGFEVSWALNDKPTALMLGLKYQRAMPFGLPEALHEFWGFSLGWNVRSPFLRSGD